MARQCEGFAARSLGAWEAATRSLRSRYARLQVERLRIVNLGRDTVCGEVRAESVARRRSHDVLGSRVTFLEPRANERVDSRKSFFVASRNGAPARAPGVFARELHRGKRTLDRAD